MSDVEAKSPLPVLEPGNVLSRRELVRAALLATLASALGPKFSFAQAINSGLTAAARGEDGSKFLSDPNWKPAFLNQQQNETLIALGEVIIPPTPGSPGAKDALVNRFLDLLISIQPPEFQKQFAEGLASIDAESQKQFGKDFRMLANEDQVSLLQPWAYPAESSIWTEEHSKTDPAQEHFSRLKGMIAFAYYGSEIGEKELGWDGEIAHGPYLGCQHPAGTHT